MSTITSHARSLLVLDPGFGLPRRVTTPQKLLRPRSLTRFSAPLLPKPRLRNLRLEGLGRTHAGIIGLNAREPAQSPQRYPPHRAGALQRPAGGRFGLPKKCRGCG